MLKTVMRLLLTGIYLVLSTVLVLMGKYASSLVFSFYPTFSRYVLSAIAAVTGVIPIALWELLLLLLLLYFIYSFLRAFTQLHFLSWVTGVAMYVSFGVFLFILLWGLNYYAPPMEERLGLPQKEYSIAELKEATAYYRDMANQTASSVARDENGAMLPGDFGLLAERAGAGFETLAKTMDCFDGSTVRVKPLLSSTLMAASGTTGIFIPFTAESSVSKLTYTAALPFTMCHEIGHRMAFAREDEANFAGFLACSVSDYDEFRYSGYYMAFRYCYNALYKVDPNAAGEIWRGVSASLAADCNSSAKHYEEVRSEAVSAVTDKVYDNYLKTFDVESGVQSYGEVADLLITWYFEEIQ